MADLRHVSRLLRTAPLADRFLLLITLALTVFVDLVVAVNVGVVLAALLFMRRMAETVRVGTQEFGGANGGSNGGTPDLAEDVVLPPNVLVYRIEGPLFFGAAEKLESTLERTHLGVDTVVIRLGRVPFMDATGLVTLAEIVQRFQRRRVRVLLCGIHEELRAPLQAAGVTTLVGADNICENMTQVAARTAEPGSRE
jgi:SulP family sulfate permease